MSGVFGAFANDQPAAALTYLGLYGLQHRGQESAGIAVAQRDRIRIHKGMGLVSQVFDEETLGHLAGSIAIGHVRYTRAGIPHIANAQPILALSGLGQVAISHNGNLANARELRSELMSQGALFQTGTDSELILNLVARSGHTSFEAAMADAVTRLVGSAALVAMSTSQLIGYRDPLGNRPLSIGKLDGGYVLASETCAFSTIGAELVREVAPGEMVVIDQDGLRSVQPRSTVPEAFCVFEFIYFARPDSEIEGHNVHLIRRQIGRVLAEEHPIEADLVIPTPDSGVSASMGYAEASGLEYDLGLVKNRYVGRQPSRHTDATRHLGNRIKLNPIRSVLRGKRVVLLDDSILRGTTTAGATQMLRDAGVKEVHMVVASPPFLHPCHYGIDVPASDHLIAWQKDPAEIAQLVGADSLHYLSLEGLFRAVGVARERLCTACFTGNYPTPIDEATASRMLEDGPHLSPTVA